MGFIMSVPLRGRKGGAGDGAGFRRSLLEGDGHFGKAARRGGIDCGDNTLHIQPQDPPLGVTDYNDGEFPGRKVLLIPKVLVRGDKHVEARRLRRVEQIAVDQPIPSAVSGLGDCVALRWARNGAGVL